MCQSLNEWQFIAQIAVAGGTITLAIVAFWSLRQSHKHNQRILEEMAKAYKPILRVRMEIDTTTFAGERLRTAQLIFDNVGRGVAIDVEANYGFVVSQHLDYYPNAREHISVSPALSKDDKSVSCKIKEPPIEADYCYVELLCKDASEKKHSFYFSIDTQENTVERITQNDYLKMKDNLVCPAK